MTGSKSGETSEADFGALIVGADPISSDLPARVLNHEHTSRATASRAVGLLQAIPKSQASVTVVGAVLRTAREASFVQAGEIRRANSDVYAVLLLARRSRNCVVKVLHAGAGSLSGDSVHADHAVRRVDSSSHGWTRGASCVRVGN